MNSFLHAPLGELAKLNPTFRAQGVAPDELVDFLPMSAVSAELTTVSATEQRTFQTVQKGYTNFAHGDVLLAKITPCFENGKIAFAELKTNFGFGSTEFHVIRADKARLDGRYLVHFLRRDEIRLDGARNMTGSGGQRRVPKHYLDSLSVPLPALSEQRRIAAILDQVDALRAKRREALAQLDSLTQSIFMEKFGDLTENTKNFSIQSLGDLCDVRDGTHDSPKFVSIGFPLVTTRNLCNGGIDLTAASLISENDYIAINKRSKVHKGDILMPMIGTIGNPVLVNIKPDFAIKNMALIKFKEDSPDVQFILHFLKSDCFRKLIDSKSKGGTQKFLALGAIRGIGIPVPPRSLQAEFSTSIKMIQHQISLNSDSLNSLDDIFLSIQHRAFRGEL